jgi:hypothetical protein
MSQVFVLGTNKQALNPMHPGRARSGDLVRAVVSSGSKQGTYVGKVAVRSSGSFNITTSRGTEQGIPARYCVLVARSDGYTYHTRKECLLPPSV